LIGAFHEDCGCVEFGQRGFDGRLQSRLELERDVVEGRLAKQLMADGSCEAAEPVVMAAGQHRTHGHVQLPNRPRRRRRWHERQQTVVIEHGQTGTRIDERLGRHLPNQRQTSTTVLLSSQQAQLSQADRPHGIRHTHGS